jgi:hypothetical protein
MSVGLIDDAGVACSGVTACDQTNSAATAIPIAPVEKTSLRIVASFVFVNRCSNIDLVTFQDFAVASQKWLRCKFWRFARVVLVKYIQNARVNVSLETLQRNNLTER